MALALALASCSLFGGDSGPKSASTAGAVPIAPRRPPSSAASTPSRSTGPPCETDFKCAKIKVPLDYSKPDGDTIEIAALKLSTKASKKGSLLVNPGGPGGSGYDFVKDAGATNISDKVRANYDLVGFDPRGVKRSAPVTCLTDQERDASRAEDLSLDTDAGLAAAPRGQQGDRGQVRRKNRPGAGPYRHRQRRQGPRHPARAHSTTPS